MAHRIPLQSLISALLALLLVSPFVGAATGTGSVLVSYSFDEAIATGPDTFAIWQGARHTSTGRGRVSLSTAFHVSGSRSVEIKDVAGDGDLPELHSDLSLRGTRPVLFPFS